MKQVKRWFYIVMLLLGGILYFCLIDQGRLVIEMKDDGLLGKEVLSDLEVRIPGMEFVEKPFGETDSIEEEISDVNQSLSTQTEITDIAKEPTASEQIAETSEETREEGSQMMEPLYETVEEDYFSDAVFIGDSRTVGLYKYGELQETSTFYAATGLSVYRLFQDRIVQMPGEKKKRTVEEALKEQQFSKIYLMLGINELGTGTVETYIEKYRECLELLQELQPQAIIYIQSIISVTEKRSQQGDYVTNEGIAQRNTQLASLADNEKIFYLDVNSVLCDEGGSLTPDYTYDGVHLKAKYVYLWKDYLKEHAVIRENNE